MTALEKYISTNINEYVSESADGYFYALCDENFTVTFAHYCKDRLPTFSGDYFFLYHDSMWMVHWNDLCRNYGTHKS